MRRKRCEYCKKLFYPGEEGYSKDYCDPMCYPWPDDTGIIGDSPHDRYVQAVKDQEKEK